MLYISAAASMMATWIATHKWIRKAPEVGLLGWDMHKPERPKVPYTKTIIFNVLDLGE